MKYSFGQPVLGIHLPEGQVILKVNDKPCGCVVDSVIIIALIHGGRRLIIVLERPISLQRISAHVLNWIRPWT